MSETENLAIMITDIVGFTERTSGQSRSEMHSMLNHHNRLMKEALEMYSGRWVKSTGDGMIATFRSPTNAVQCGMAIQDAFAEYNHELPETEQIHVRVAVNLGEVRWEGKSDIFGEAVNVAARIESITPPGEVYFTQAVYLAMNKAEVPSAAVGTESIRGVPEDVEVFRVPVGQATRLVASGEPMDSTPGVQYPFGGVPHPRSHTGVLEGRRGKRRKLIIGAVVALLVLILVSRPEREPAPAEPSPPPAGSAEPAASDPGNPSLTVVAQPADARVRILNIRPRYRPGMSLEPGRYQVEVSRDGYRTETRWVDLREDTELAVSLQAAAKPRDAGVETRLPPDPGNATDAVRRRNDLLLVLSEIVDTPRYLIERHPDSAWANVFRVALDNNRQALRRLRVDAEKGSAEAQVGLAYLYARGTSATPRSLRDMRQWAEKASQNDRGLALWLRSATLLGDREMRRAERSRAVGWLEESSRLGEPLADATLGILYLEGDKVDRDYDKGRTHLQRAAAKGMAFAESALAGLYLEGKGVRKDVNEAIALLNRAAGKQDPAGMFYLGLLYERGYGVERDRELANALYRLSAATGFKAAKDALAGAH